jgi:hypothetical protein
MSFPRNDIRGRTTRSSNMARTPTTLRVAEVVPSVSVSNQIGRVGCSSVLLAAGSAAIISPRSRGGYQFCPIPVAPADTGLDAAGVGRRQCQGFRTAEATSTYPGGAQVPLEGHKVTLGGTTCGIGYQGAATCETEPHGFTSAATYGVLH